MNSYHTAEKIVETLRQKGFIAYFAGGWVRDYLMGHPSSDIDIATNASPEDIVKLFKKTILVGVQFGVVVVVLNNHHFEVSTFRKDLEYSDGRRPKGIIPSNEEEDALRRDFTINGMFYDPEKKQVIDYVHGQKDLKNKIIRTIGDPNERFKEDRLRMLRAIRFAFRFDFVLDPQTRSAIKANARTLFPAVAKERIWQELQKMAGAPRLDLALMEMHQLDLLSVIFPLLAHLDLETLKKRLISYKFFPKKCPFILFFMELFPDEKEDVLEDICLNLKVSNKELKIVFFVARARACLCGSIICEDVDWAKLYADSFWDMALEVVAARLNQKEREELLKIHKTRKEFLRAHIERIVAKKSLITSEDLKKEGVSAGKRMGQLLNEAEKITVNRNLHDKNQVLALLKKSPLWTI